MLRRALTPLRTQILVALLNGDQTAYQITKTAQADTGAGLIVRERHVYTAVPALLRDGLIQSGQFKGTYRLTDFSRRLLRAEEARLTVLSRLIRERLSGDKIR